MSIFMQSTGKITFGIWCTVSGHLCSRKMNSKMEQLQRKNMNEIKQGMKMRVPEKRLEELRIV